MQSLFVITGYNPKVCESITPKAYMSSKPVCLRITLMSDFQGPVPPHSLGKSQPVENLDLGTLALLSDLTHIPHLYESLSGSKTMILLPQDTAPVPLHKRLSTGGGLGESN